MRAQGRGSDAAGGRAGAPSWTPLIVGTAAPGQAGMSCRTPPRPTPPHPPVRRDLVGALEAEHALGRLLLHDIPHERVPQEEQRILGVHRVRCSMPYAVLLLPP